MLATLRVLPALICLLLAAPLLAEVPSDWSDAEIEEALAQGEILEIVDIGEGITKPKRVTLRHRDVTLRAAFKYVHTHRMKRTRFESGPERATLSFTDSYRYERAAYLLDRRLGLRMVPVTVFREIDGVQGSLILWVENAITEGKRLERGISAGDAAVVVHQKALMRVFDALIFNADRNQGNRLYTYPGPRLHLIDHSRAFRNLAQLPEEFSGQPVTITRELEARLRSLAKDELRGLLEGALSREQVRQILKRRKKILAKLAKDLDSYGEALVYVSPPTPESSSAPQP